MENATTESVERDAKVYSLAEKRAEIEARERARIFGEILKLVAHYKNG